MKTPLQLLHERRREISAQYQRLLSFDPYHILSSKERNKDSESVDEFRKENKKMRDGLKSILDEYDEAINILYTIKNETFEF